MIAEQASLRESLARLIDAAPGCRCSGRFHSLAAAATGLGGRPRVALVDLGPQRVVRGEVIALLQQLNPGLVVVVMTDRADDERVFDALRAGASGCLLHKTPGRRLISALREARDGGMPLAPEVAQRVLVALRAQQAPPRTDYQLTAYELPVLRLLTEGCSYKAAAAALKISVKTVSFHLQNIYQKLQVHSKSEAVAKALRYRLV